MCEEWLLVNCSQRADVIVSARQHRCGRYVLLLLFSVYVADRVGRVSRITPFSCVLWQSVPHATKRFFNIFTNLDIGYPNDSKVSYKSIRLPEYDRGPMSGTIDAVLYS